MGTLRNTKTGETYELSDSEAVAAARENPDLEIVGAVRVSPTESIREGASLASDTWRRAAGTGETEEHWHEQHEEAAHDNAASTLKATGGSFVDALSLGLVSPWEEDRKYHPIASGIGTGAALLGTLAIPGAGEAAAARAVEGAGELSRLARAGEVIGGAASHTPLGLATRLGSRAGAAVGGAIRGEGAIAGLARAGAAAATEGGVFGAGQGVSELLHSDDPVTVERALSVIGSNVLSGAAIGGAVGVGGKALGMGLRRAKTALDDIVEKGASSDAVALAERAQVADDIKALRAEMKENKIWLATKDADVKAIKEVREVGKIALEADRSVDRMLRNPKALALRPQRVLDGLQQQEHALESLIKQGDNLRPIFANDASGARVAALDYASVALEKNRAIQARIAEVTAKPAEKAASSGLGDIMGEAALGHMLGAATGIPILGQAIAAGRIGMRVVQKLGLDTTAAAARGSQAIQTFLNVGAKVAPKAPVVATKVLGNVAFGPAQKPRRGAKLKQPDLADHYQARTAELHQLVAPGPDGKPMMRPEARARVAEQLAPIRAAHPLLADKLETAHARKIEYYADTMPKKPDVFASALGQDNWRPSDMEMRSWTRRIAAGEDPDAVIDRLSDGSITPEDVETMRAVAPEMHAQFVRQIIEQLGELQTKLPYQRRLALSMFSGVAVDPAMNPQVLNMLQSQFEAEEGSEGGTQAPVAQPAFGSVSKPKPTPAQERAG